MRELQGIYPILNTTFHEDGSLDLESQSRLVNYLLEIVPEVDHALALGVTNSLMVVTAPALLLFGWAADRFGYGPVLAFICLTVAAAALAALGLEEPRGKKAAKQ